MVHNNMNAREEDFLKQLKENSDWYLMLGIGLIALGTLAVVFSLISSIVTVLYLGIFLIISGFFETVKSFKMSKWSNVFLHLGLSLLYILAGFFIVFNPGLSELTLTLMLAIFFVIAGISRIIFSFAKNIPNKSWILINGILSLILGILIWKQWPVSGLWVIGTIVGIDAIFTGWTWIMLSIEAKNLKIQHH